MRYKDNGHRSSAVWSAWISPDDFRTFERKVVVGRDVIKVTTISTRETKMVRRRTVSTHYINKR